MRERLRNYELMFIISPLRSSEEDISATVNRVRQAITALDGEVISVNQSPPWGRRKFAYPIRDFAEGESNRRSFNEGFYVLCHFRLPTTRITEIERSLKLNDAILRYLLTLVEPKTMAAVPGAAVALDVDADADSDADLAEAEDEDADFMDEVEEDDEA